jgi:hypothetical protein
MEYIAGIFIGVAILGVAKVIFGIMDKLDNKRIEQERSQRREVYKKFEQKIDSLPPYKFAVNRDRDGWKWEVLYLYVGRGHTYHYDPVLNASGNEQTKEAAIAAGRASCEQYTNIKNWKEQREVYSLDSHGS